MVYELTMTCCIVGLKFGLFILSCIVFPHSFLSITPQMQKIESSHSVYRLSLARFLWDKEQHSPMYKETLYSKCSSYSAHTW